MEFKELKDSLFYIIDYGASREFVVKNLTEDKFNLFIDSDIKPTEEEVNKIIDKLLLSEELVYDLMSGMLYVTEFMPWTASKITGKNYHSDVVRKLF